MMASADTHGVVSIAALDLRRRPSHKSELKSQLLMGEIVRRLESGPSGRWWRVESLADGYRGWVRTWGIVPASRTRADRWRRRAGARVDRNHVEVRSGRGRGSLVTPLFWNARVILRAVRGSWAHVELPDGRSGWAPAAAFVSGRSSRTGLADRLRELLGTPYLWGGRTPLGFDCSGFTQQMLAEQGIQVPRDADEQFRATRPIGEGRRLREGDLAFFGPRKGRVTHVGLLMGGGYFAHARGMVRVNSLDPDNQLYDKSLSRQVRGFGRPARGRRAG
jgi:cell wall-associated NlpC family hydrolase